MISKKNKILIALTGLLLASQAFCQTSQPYTGDTFDKIKSSGRIVLGYRSGAIPISYVDENKQPIGYGVDICMNIVQKIKEKLSMPDLSVEYLEVNANTRIPMLVEGKIDMECGSTTNNASRRKDVDFTVPYYMAGIRILAKSNSGITSLNDLVGKKVSMGEKTSSIPLVEGLNKERDMHITSVIEKDYTTCLNDVGSGKTDAFILDDLLLFGERSKASNPKDYNVVGDFLSVEPLAIMVRKNDPKFKTFVDKQMISIINSGQIETYYKKWFQSPIPPKNQNLNIPASPLLKDIFRMPTPVVGN